MNQLETWLSQGRRIAVATVISTWGSSPRRPGARLFVNDQLGLIGSVSAGCVEGAVIETALTVMETQEPRLLKFGVANERAWNVGLACGGEIEVFVEPYSPVFEHETGYLITQLTGHQAGRHLLLNAAGQPVYSELLDVDQLRALELKTHIATLDDERYFCHHLRQPRKLIIVGGNHIAVALCQLARVLQYQLTVIDPRQVFAQSTRFPDVDVLISAWPQEAFEQITIDRDTAVIILAHDPKLDHPTLEIVLQSPAFYIGMLGSQKTQAERQHFLLDRGFTREQLQRIHGPIGLNIGAQSPEEIALAILSEIVMCQEKN